MVPNAPHNAKKLVGTHWTAVNAAERRKHWEVERLCADGQGVVIVAVLDGHREEMSWRALRDRSQWLPGWVRGSSAERKKIFSFEGPSSSQNWKSVDDVVMGGRSLSQVRWIEEDGATGALRFEGEISLENNGGFCSARNHGEWDLSGAKELIWRVRGTDRRFLATLRDEHTPYGASFRASFMPGTEGWGDVRLGLEEFRLYRRGQPLSVTARVDPAMIRSFGFLLADCRAGAFFLDLAELWAR